MVYNLGAFTSLGVPLVLIELLPGVRSTWAVLAMKFVFHVLIVNN